MNNDDMLMQIIELRKDKAVIKALLEEKEKQIEYLKKQIELLMLKLKNENL